MGLGFRFSGLGFGELFGDMLKYVYTTYRYALLKRGFPTAAQPLG